MPNCFLLFMETIKLSKGILTSIGLKAMQLIKKVKESGTDFVIICVGYEMYKNPKIRYLKAIRQMKKPMVLHVA